MTSQRWILCLMGALVALSIAFTACSQRVVLTEESSAPSSSAAAEEESSSEEAAEVEEEPAGVPFESQELGFAVTLPSLLDGHMRQETSQREAYGETISTAGLFGQAQEVEQLTAQQWLERQVAQATAAPRQESLRDRVTQEDEDSGISFGKVVLTVFLPTVIFGGDRRRRRGCGCSGCGCAPFSSLLAGLGLWKLWGDDRH